MEDLNYITDGFFITLVANTDEGAYIYSEIAKAFDGVAKFPVHMKPSIFKQIKDAGYTIKKARKPKQSINDILDNDLLSLLGV